MRITLLTRGHSVISQTGFFAFHYLQYCLLRCSIFCYRGMNSAGFNSHLLPAQSIDDDTILYDHLSPYCTNNGGSKWFSSSFWSLHFSSIVFMAIPLFYSWSQYDAVFWKPSSVRPGAFYSSATTCCIKTSKIAGWRHLFKSSIDIGIESIHYRFPGPRWIVWIWLMGNNSFMSGVYDRNSMAQWSCSPWYNLDILVIDRIKVRDINWRSILTSGYVRPPSLVGGMKSAAYSKEPSWGNHPVKTSVISSFWKHH